MVGNVVNKIVIPVVAIIWFVSLDMTLIQANTEVSFGFFGFLAFVVTLLGFIVVIILFIVWIISLFN